MLKSLHHFTTRIVAVSLVQSICLASEIGYITPLFTQEICSLLYYVPQGTFRLGLNAEWKYDET